jgi:molybdopterin synthase catalytic subunit
LELEHYPAMAQKALEEIAAEAQRRWAITACTIIHRHGTLKPGDQIVLVVTASSHRPAAFEAASFLMDYLKTRAPFWKRETTGTGTRWVEAQMRDDDAAARWKE